jgi:hypothetical protein
LSRPAVCESAAVIRGAFFCAEECGHLTFEFIATRNGTRILFYAGWAKPQFAFVASSAFLLLLALAVALLFQRMVRAPQPARASCAA